MTPILQSKAILAIEGALERAGKGRGLEGAGELAGDCDNPACRPTVEAVVNLPRRVVHKFFDEAARATHLPVVYRV
jgi:hypothetical protein